jgi:hypothetical protein
VSLVWNPQTDILRYAREVVAHYEWLAFGTRNFKSDGLPVDTNVLGPPFASNRTIYLQNAPDNHTKTHLQPFLAAQGHAGGVAVGETARVTDLLTVFLGVWGPKHAPPPKQSLMSILSELVRPDFRWERLAEKGLTSLSPELVPLHGENSPKL